MQKLRISSSGNLLPHKITCLCGHCNNQIALEIYAQYFHNTDYHSSSDRERNENGFVYDYYTGQCPYCGKPIIYNIKNKSTYPASSNFEKVKYLPEDIDTLYNECREAHSVEAYTCCVIAARTLMANVAVEQGAAPGKNFIEYVNYLQENCLPPKTNNNWVDKIRQLGNESTHKLKIATQEDSTLVINFIIAILKNVYEFPNSI